jgi:hypothetical protein
MSETLNSGTSDNSNAWLDEWFKLKDREHDKFKENAAQELVEREFNSELTKVEDLKTAIEAGEKGITGEQVKIPFEDGSIRSVYLIVLGGYPFKTLQSDISVYNQKDSTNLSEYGQTHRTSDKLRSDPSFWMKKKDEIDGLGKNTSATFCASYYDTEVGVPELMGGRCSYGFDHVRPNSVVSTYRGDMSSIPAEDTLKPDFWSAGEPETAPIPLNELADVGHTMWDQINEVLINRYDELGNPQKPDYILARGKEGFNRLSVLHAIHHNIPLVIIKPERYKEIKVEDEMEWDDSCDNEEEN